MTSRGSVPLGLHAAAERRPDLVDVMELAARWKAAYEVDHTVRSGPVYDEVDDLLAHHRVGVFADERRQLGAALDVVRGHARRRASVQRAVGCEVGVGLVLADRLRVLPLLGMGRVTRPDEPLSLMLQLLVGPGTDLVATAIHGLLLSYASALTRPFGPAKAWRGENRASSLQRRWSPNGCDRRRHGHGHGSSIGGNRGGTAALGAGRRHPRQRTVRWYDDLAAGQLDDPRSEVDDRSLGSDDRWVFRSVIRHLTGLDRHPGRRRDAPARRRRRSHRHGPPQSRRRGLTAQDHRELSTLEHAQPALDRLTPTRTSRLPRPARLL